MGFTRVTVSIKALRSRNGVYESLFLVDTGATDCLAPAKKLSEIGVEAVGKASTSLPMARFTNILTAWSKSLSWARSQPAA